MNIPVMSTIEYHTYIWALGKSVELMSNPASTLLGLMRERRAQLVEQESQFVVAIDLDMQLLRALIYEGRGDSYTFFMEAKAAVIGLIASDSSYGVVPFNS